MEDIRPALQDEQLTCNPHDHVRRSLSSARISRESQHALMIDKLKRFREGRYSATPAVLEPPKSREIISWLPSDGDSGYEGSPYTQNPLLPTIDIEDSCFPSPYALERMKSSLSFENWPGLDGDLQSYSPSFPPTNNSTTVAEASFAPALQRSTIWDQPSPTCQDTNMYPAMYVPTDYNGLDTTTKTGTLRHYTPPSAMQYDHRIVREMKRGEPAAAGIPDSVGESSLDAPNQPRPINLQCQMVNRPSDVDKLGGVKTLFSAPLTDVSSTRGKQENSTAELSKDSLKHIAEKKDTIGWIMSIKDTSAAPSPSPPIYSPDPSPCSFEAAPRHVLPGESLKESRALVMELFWTLSRQDCESSPDELSSPEESPIQSRYSSTPLTDGSGADTSPKSGTTTSISGFERNHKRSHLIRAGSSQEGDGDEPSRKESRQDKNPSCSEAMASLQGRLQMPCPVQQPQKCQGTNATISELLRSLEVRHRIVICKDCCTKVPVPEDRKPENVRKRHKSGACEPRCIGIACSGTPSDGMPHHRRTENCPTWQSLPSEARWSFIWGLINPGEGLPNSDFYTGVGYEHNTTRRPCKPQSRPRGADICEALVRDIEERDKKRISLETELEASHERNAQLEEKQKKKIDSLENIIETLLERLEENTVKVPNSLQKRLQEECPGVFCEPVAQLISKRSQAPPTPSSIFKNGAGDLGQSQSNQAATAILQPPLFSSVGPGDDYSQPFDIDFGGELFTNFNYTDDILADSSQQLPGGAA